MKRSIVVSALLAGWLATLEASAVVITSNDFNAFQTAVQNAAPGTTFTFNLGSNSTITFISFITIPNDITFVGDNAVTFDGGGKSLLFFIPTTSSGSFSGFTFQNASGTDANSGAIISSGQLTVTNSSFFHNHAVNNGGAIDGNMHVSNCVFAFNDAGNTGGAVSTGGGPFTMFVENSTFFSNYAGNTGGAVSGGTASETLLNDTIYGNSSLNVGGGVENDSRGTMLIKSSLIAGNTSFTATADFDANNSATVFNSLVGNPAGNNLANGMNGNVVGNGTSIGAFPIASLLGPLQNNGGPTETMALLNSGMLANPAIDAGSNPDELQFDQRGSPFARQIGAGVDIGAFEAVPEIPSICLASIGGVSVAMARFVGRRRIAIAV